MSQYVIIKFLMERILWFIYILWLGLTLFVIHVIFKISNRRRLLQFLKKNYCDANWRYLKNKERLLKNVLIETTSYI